MYFGIKIRYWNLYRRTESQRRLERNHVTRFGPYWVVDITSPSTQKKGFVGIWRGRTSPSGKRPPSRGAAQRIGPLPYGLGPMQVQMIKRRWSMDATNELKLSNDPFAAQRIRDFANHIVEQAPGGAASEHPAWDLAVESFWFVRTDQLRWALGPVEGMNQDRPSLFDTYVAAGNGYHLENVTGTIEERRAGYSRDTITGEILQKKFKPKPVRERKKAGRKPIGPVAMTSAERKRKQRRAKALQRPQPHGCTTVDANQQSVPRLLTVSTAPFTPNAAEGGDTK